MKCQTCKQPAIWFGSQFCSPDCAVKYAEQENVAKEAPQLFHSQEAQ